MRRLTFLGLILVAVFASAGALTSSAFGALPRNLPEVGVERTWIGASIGELELLGGGLSESFRCKGAPMTGTEEAQKPLGLFHMELKGCKTTKTKVACTGLGDAAETVLALGKWHLVFDQLTPTLLSAILFLFDPIHFNCSALVLVLMLGALVCLHLNPTVESTSHEYHCIVKKEGETEAQEDKKYFDNAGNPVTAELLCGVNEPAKETPFFVLGLGSITYKEKIFADI